MFAATDLVHKDGNRRIRALLEMADLLLPDRGARMKAAYDASDDDAAWESHWRGVLNAEMDRQNLHLVHDGQGTAILWDKDTPVPKYNPTKYRRPADVADENRDLRAALKECESALSLLRYRGAGSIEGYEVDRRIGAARRLLYGEAS